MDPFLIKKPLVTEKSTALSSASDGKYVFIVNHEATKPEIKKAIGALYKVKVVRVNMVNRRGKAKRTGALRGSQRGYKKAIVTLKKGQKIDIQ